MVHSLYLNDVLSVEKRNIIRSQRSAPSKERTSPSLTHNIYKHKQARVPIPKQLETINAKRDKLITNVADERRDERAKQYSPAHRPNVSLPFTSSRFLSKTDIGKRSLVV